MHSQSIFVRMRIIFYVMQYNGEMMTVLTIRYVVHAFLLDYKDIYSEAVSTKQSVSMHYRQ